jgi:2-dehydropantoate 2-reductase
VVDWVLVATKTYDAAGAATWFPRLRAEGAPVAVLQNGIEHRELFARWVDADKILPVLLYCPAERTSPTQFRQRRDARVDVPADALGRAFADLFRGTRVMVTPRGDFTTALWRKLGVNAAGILNALLLRPAGLFQERGMAELVRAITRECVAVGRAEGAQLNDSFVDEVLELYRANPADSINSLHADVLAGRPTELASRNGVVVRLGRKHGIATPYTDMAVRLLELFIADRSSKVPGISGLA